MPKHQFYKQQLDRLNEEYNIYKKRSKIFLWLRLLVFIVFAYLTVQIFLSQFLVFNFMLSVTFFLVFIIVLYNDNKITTHMEFLVAKMNVVKEELNFLNYNYAHKHSGVEFEKFNPFLSNDFNLLGNGSIFQYINRANTAIGRETFAKKLCAHEKDTKQIRELQVATKELFDKIDFMQDFQANSRAIVDTNTDLNFLIEWSKKPQENLKAKRIIAIALFVLNVVWILLSTIGILNWSLIIFPIIISQSYVYFNKKQIKRTNSIHNIVIISKFKQYINLLTFIENEKFESEHLLLLQSKLNSNYQPSSKSLKSLFNILEMSELQQNAIVSLVLNTVFLADIHICHHINKWRKQNEFLLEDWFNSIAEMEVAISLATYAFNNETEVCYPNFSTDVFKIEARDMGHPLLSPDVRVNNDILIEKSPSIQIITGANMAGKSTFLRTLAVNIILASNGAPVIAKSFNYLPCDIMSSIKVQDSLAKKESYFYAELLRLKDIVEHGKVNANTLVILDEILRGTNTIDKQKGSLGILNKLLSLNLIVIIATHDLSIAELEKAHPNVVKNSCFEVEMSNDELYFDYKLKDGITKKLNASYLLKKMELID